MLLAQNWGLTDYMVAFDRQRDLVAEILDGGLNDYLIYCEHPKVITLGRNSKRENVLFSKEHLQTLNVELYESDRGGDVTLHNEGQLVGYPILNLYRYNLDLHWYLRAIEQAIIDALEEFNIKAGRVDGLTGVWIDGKRKICAIGVHCSRWITSHGFAFNINNNLDDFNLIVPCGIIDKNKTVISLSKELGKEIDMKTVRLLVDEHLRINLNKY